MRFLNRLGKSLTVGVCLIVAVVTVLSAAYSATLSLTENGTAAYTQVGVKVPANVSNWVSQNFIAADGLDVQLLKGSTHMPFMLATDALYFADGIAQGGTNNYTLTTGNTPSTSMQIVTGDGGYVTVADAAALELGNNFEVETSGYVSTSTSGNIINKSGAFQLTTGSGSVTASILSSTTYTSSAYLTSNNLYNGAATKFAQLINGATGSFTCVIDIKKTGSPTGTAYARIWNAADNTLIGEMGSINVSTLTSSSVDYSFSSPVTLAGQNVYIGIEYTGGDAGNLIGIGIANNAAPMPNTAYKWQGGAWSNIGNDMRTSISYTVATKSVTSVVSSGEHTIKVTADATNLKLYIDTVEEDSVALAGASVPDNANNWVLFNDIPYVNYYKHTVGGTLISHYQPEAIISGTTLPDLEGAAQNGTITFGSNPAGLSGALGIFRAESTTATGSTGTPQPGIIGGVGGIDNTSSTTTGTFVDSLIAVFVTTSNGSLTTELAWWGLYGICLLIAYILTYAKFQYTFLAGVASVIVSVIFCVAFNTIPDVMMALNIALVIGITFLESRSTI